MHLMSASTVRGSGTLKRSSGRWYIAVSRKVRQFLSSWLRQDSDASQVDTEKTKFSSLRGSSSPFRGVMLGTMKTKSASPNKPIVGSMDQILMQSREVIHEVRALLDQHEFSPVGRKAQSQLAGLLEALGFSVALEVAVPNYSRVGRDGSARGFIDLVAGRGDILVGFEIDCWRTAKSKSVAKLAAFSELTHRVVLLNHAPGMGGKRAFLPRAVATLHSQIDLAVHLRVTSTADPTIVSGAGSRGVGS